jgi:hypothetical protein
MPGDVRRSLSSASSSPEIDPHELGRYLQILAICGDDEWLTDLTRLVRKRLSIVAPDMLCDGGDE